MTKKLKCDVVVVGAGVPGIMLALKLSKFGLKVTLLEKQKLPQHSKVLDIPFKNGRSVALMKTSCHDLSEWGVLETLRDIICPLECLQIIDDSYFSLGDVREDKMMAQKFYADELGEPRFGYNIPLTPLLACMQNLVAENDMLTVIDNAAIESISFGNDSAIVTLADQEITAKLVIGADGRDSVVRGYAGIGVHKRDYHTQALTCVVSHTQPHDNTSTEFHRSGGPFTLVPLLGNKSAIVWSEKDTEATDFMALDEASLTEALQLRSRNILGKIRLESKLHAWPLISMQAKSIIHKRCALIAEAAHVMSPIGAQGMNLSLRDMHSLSDIIKEAAFNGLDIGSVSVLQRYKALRAKDMILRNRGVDLFHRGVANKNPLLRKLRRSVLQTVPMVTPLREALMREGLSVRE